MKNNCFVTLAGLVIVFFLVKCSSPAVPSNVYLGAFKTADLFIPNPKLLIQEENKLSIYDRKGQLIDHANIDSNLEKKDTIFFENHVYELAMQNKALGRKGLLDLTDTTINKNYRNTEYFQQLDKTPKIDLQNFKKILQSKIWNYDRRPLNPNRNLKMEYSCAFEEEGCIVRTQYSFGNELLHSEYESFKYYCFELGELYFLRFETDEPEEKPMPIFQLLSAGNNSFRIKNVSHAESKDESFNSIGETKQAFALSLKNSRPFKRCFDHHAGEYYYTNSTYKKGNEYLERELAKTLSHSNQDGYINFHFNINCEGEIGRFGLELMDLNFQACDFDEKVVKEVFDFLDALDDWPSDFKSPNKWLPYEDVHAFLMFIIKDGKIVDVCP